MFVIFYHVHYIVGKFSLANQHKVVLQFRCGDQIVFCICFVLTKEYN
jgi:hypothetical protein